MLLDVDINELKATFFNEGFEAFVILDKNLNFVDVGAVLLEFSNLTKERVIGKNVCEISPGLEKTERYKLYLRVLRTGKSEVVEETKVHPLIGDVVTKIKAFRLGEGLGLSILNISDLKKVKEDFSMAKKKLEIANFNLERKNENLEEFSFLAAHDLKAPQTNIQGLLKLLDNDKYITPAGRQVFEKIQTVSDSMCDKILKINEIIALKLDLSTSSKEIIRFSDILKKVECEFENLIKESKAIIKSDFSEFPKIEYPAKQLYILIHNLLINAIKFKDPEKAPSIFLKTSIENEVPVLIVEDNGLGFEEQMGKNKIFGLFKRMHPDIDGLGVGLYVVNEIVKTKGGHIKVSSKPNKGTTFKLYLLCQK